jgi:Rps23 Pro-64 3,4-dihydroxylase Tpa1-like proline 4-hydroxylase
MRIIENVLPEQLCYEIGGLGYRLTRGYDLTEEELNIQSWTNFRWHSDLNQESTPVLCYSMPKSLSKQIIPFLKKNDLFSNETEESLREEMKFMIYVWTKGSWINWHGDAHAKQAVTIYLNKDWHYNDGGLFIWQDETTSELKVVEPKFNTLVYNEGSMMHGTTPVTSSTSLRITVQGFMLRSDAQT